jgi:hypothetical protein
MSTDPTIHPTGTTGPPAAGAVRYCDCAIPLAAERAERHGAAVRVCNRCELPLALTLRRW